MYPNGSQVRAARALLGISREELAARAKVSVRTVNNIENGDTRPIRSTLEAVMSVLIAEGIRFVPEDDDLSGGRGVLLDK